MSEFRLEEWEIGPRCRERAMGVSSGVVRGNLYRAVEMRRRKWVVFVQESEGQNTGNWMVASTDDVQPQVWREIPVAAQFESEADWGATVGRFFTWGEEMAFLNASGDGAWLNAHLEAEAHFTGAALRELIEQDNPETFALLTRNLTGESDFAFARRWMTLDREAKLSLLYGGQLEEICSLMRSVLLLIPSTQTWQPQWVWHVGVGEKYSYGRAVRREPDFLYEWGQLIIEHLSALSTFPRRTHPCLAQFAETGESCVEVESCSSSTQHEHLEAHLLLRDWLQQNAPDEMDLLEANT